MNGYGRFLLPVAVAVAAVGYLAIVATPPDDPADGMHLNQFGALPVIDKGNGRTRPLEGVARTKMMVISGKQTFYDEQKNEHSAVEWMLDTLTAGRNLPADDHKVFRIENDQVLNLLGLEPRPGSYRYSFAEIYPRWRALGEADDRIREKKEEDRDLFDQKVTELTDHLRIELELAGLETPMLLNPDAPDHPRALGDVVSEYYAAKDAAKAQGQPPPAPPLFLIVLTAYGQNRPADFNAAVDAYQKQLETTMPAETHKAAFESWFDSFDPFYQCALLYFGVFLLTCLSWVAYTKPLNTAAMALAGVTFLVHTTALISRMYLMNRWGVFVTNLYGTAIFIGWVAVLLGLIFEALNRNGIGTFVASVAGFATMVVAQFLAMGEDTMEMMRAVLDTNFWLATHVTTVNVGYAGTMTAGLLGALFIFRGLLTTSLDKPAVKMLGDAIYGVVCFATLFSFTGTVLGGIWADQSWGRFWGWDPKENGALLIVVWNALILHARWGGLVKQRGMAVLTLFGNVIVMWSWWGVNMLGVGLHAYANADPTMLTTVLVFVGIFLGIMAAGMLPLSMWRSFSADQAAAPPPNGRPPLRGKTGIMPEPA